MRIEKDGLVVEDSSDNLIETEDGITCGCSNPRLKMVCHMDWKDFYSYSYQCCACGNSIVATHKRTAEDMMMWE